MKRIGLTKRLRKALRGSSPGLTLVEIVIAMALIAIVGVAILGGLSNAMYNLHIADVRTTAESLARSEMERVKSSHPYHAPSWSYEANASSSTCTSLDDVCPDWFIDHGHGYEGYTLKVEAGPLNDADNGETQEIEGIKTITVTVSHQQRGEVVTLVGYKVDRS